MSSTASLSLARFIPVIGTKSKDTMEARTLYALSSLLVLVQLPHVLNMPLWVSAMGLGLVIARLAWLKKPHIKVLAFLLSPLNVTIIGATSALLIKLDYGYVVGRDPCVAFLFILVAAKFAEVRKPADATLLLCLCAFLLLTQYFYSQTILAALVTVPAVLALTYCLSVLRDPKTPQGFAFQFKLVGKLLIQGLPLAALLFILFPRLPGPMWSLPEDAGATTGLSDSMSPGSIGKLSQSDEVAFRVEFDGETPTKEQLYWRAIVLSTFNGRNWSRSDQTFTAPQAYVDEALRHSDETISYTVTLKAHQQRWLFALDTAIDLPRSYNSAAQTNTPSRSRAIGMLYDDGQMLSREPIQQPIRYRQTSTLSDVMPAVLKPRSDTLYLPGENEKAIAFAKQLRATVSSDRSYANAVLKHFNDQPFRYTLEPQLLGSSPVDEFLFETQEGFCEHYASAYVVLMRAAGIPARIVTGYLGGQMNNEYLIVRQSDAHAWSEIFLDGAWQRVDPTAAVAPSRVEQGLAAALPSESAVPRLARMAPGLFNDALLQWDALNYHWQRLVIDFDDDSQLSFWKSTGLDKVALWQLCVAVLLIIGIWSALVLGLPLWRSSHLPPQERRWQQLQQTLKANALTRHHGESAEEFLHRAGKRWPACQLQFTQLNQSFEQLRFQAITEAQRLELSQQLRMQLLWLQVSLPFRRKAI